MKLHQSNFTRAAVSMAAVGLGVNTDHVGDVRRLNAGSVKHLLTKIVKLIGENTPLNPDSVVSFLSNEAIRNLG